MKRRPRHGIAGLLVATIAGCGTVVSFPEPMGGLTMHIVAVDDPAVVPLWLAFLPLTLTDLTLSFTADVLLLPFTIPYHVVQRHPAPAQPRPRPAAASAASTAEVTSARATAAASYSFHEEAFDWLSDARRDRNLFRRHELVRLAEDRQGTIFGMVVSAHLAERAGQIDRALELCDLALRTSPASSPARLVRGWTHLRAAQLDLAEADLRLAFMSCLHPLNRAWAQIGLGRIAEARGVPAMATRHYHRALDEAAASDVALAPDHHADVWARIAALEAR